MNTKVIRKINLNPNNQPARYGSSRKYGNCGYDHRERDCDCKKKYYKKDCDCCCKKVKCDPCSGGPYGKYDRSPCAYKNMGPVQVAQVGCGYGGYGEVLPYGGLYNYGFGFGF